MKSKKLRNLLLAIASGALMSSLLIGVPAVQAATGKNCKLNTPTSQAFCDSITVGQVGRTTSLDPNGPSRTVNGNYVSRLLMQGLLWRFGADGKPKQDLIKTVKQSEDLLTWTLTLKDLKYSDGKTPVQASDAVAMWDYLKKNPVTPLAPVESITAPDAKTIVIKTFKPFKNLPSTFATIYFFMNPGDKINDPKYWDNPLSAGPYKLKEWKTGDDKLVLEVNPNYWAKPAVKQITFLVIPDPVTRIIALRQGTIDYAFDLPLATGRGQLGDKKLFRWQPTQLQGTFTLDFNLRNMKDCATRLLVPSQCLPEKVLPWHDPKVRQALSMAVDRKAIGQIAFFGDVKPSCALIWPGHHAYKCQNPDRTKQNLAGAKKLLAEAGYPDGFPITISVHNRPGWADAISIIAADWRKLGSKMVVNTDPQVDAVGEANQAAGNFEVRFSGATGATPGPLYGIYYGQNGAWQRWAGSNYSIEDVLAIDAAKTDKEEAEAIAKVEKKMWEESAHIFVGQRAVFGASRLPLNIFSNIKGNDQYFVKQTPPLS